MSKWMIILAIFSVVAIIAGYHYYRTQTHWVASDDYKKPSENQAQTLVVSYSRTGNTEAAAKEAAKFFDADLITIQAPAYINDLSGLKQASDDAMAELETTDLIHEPIDLQQYDLIILSTPTWWFRPAVPMWAFVNSQQFYGKKVFLMMTGNSRYEPAMIEKFADRVTAQNGEYLDMLFVQRGRIFWQKSKQEVNAEVSDALSQLNQKWEDILN
ncbi:flavodoxin family protein [Gayadomonas joobiniege]|uniref:flavodoxin family protein n=1 Tax=Gayadomonas joobiniege TaxID=1234606 RepID=UPI00035EA7DB|nr:hypothetical protein [Gayadomonas joobiniege]